jgi:hypothetical protein
VGGPGGVRGALTAVFLPCRLNYLDDPAPGRPLPDAVFASAVDLPADRLRDQIAALRRACASS